MRVRTCGAIAGPRTGSDNDGAGEVVVAANSGAACNADAALLRGSTLRRESMRVLNAVMRSMRRVGEHGDVRLEIGSHAPA